MDQTGLVQLVRVRLNGCSSVAVWPPTWVHEKRLTSLYAALPSVTKALKQHVRLKPTTLGNLVLECGQVRSPLKNECQSRLSDSEIPSIQSVLPDSSISSTVWITSIISSLSGDEGCAATTMDKSMLGISWHLVLEVPILGGVNFLRSGKATGT